MCEISEKDHLIQDLMGKVKSLENELLQTVDPDIGIKLVNDPNDTDVKNVNIDGNNKGDIELVEILGLRLDDKIDTFKKRLLYVQKIIECLMVHAQLEVHLRQAVKKALKDVEEKHEKELVKTTKNCT